MKPRCCRNCDILRRTFPKDVCKPEELMAAEMVGKCQGFRPRQGWDFAFNVIEKYRLEPEK